MGMLCVQTGDTSIELYWRDDTLHSRKGKGDAATPAYSRRRTVRQSVVEENEGTAMWLKVINKTGSAQFMGGMPIAESAAKAVVDP